MFEEWKKDILSQLELNIEDLAAGELRDALKYATLPAGKLFRPLLIYSLANDLGEIQAAHRNFACSIECHHSYTLIHDDLPAMDDDDIRRGKPSTHIKYGEWLAILAGDALLNLSFRLISKLPKQVVTDILAVYGEKTGANGLILGQVIDMQARSQKLEDILRVHELKTASLMQLCLIGTCHLSNRPDMLIDMDKLGKYIGVSFQLWDDLCEFSGKLGDHELEANPFLRFSPKDVLAVAQHHYDESFKLFGQYQLSTLQKYLNTFYLQIHKKLNTDKSIIYDKTGLSPADWAFLAPAGS